MSCNLENFIPVSFDIEGKVSKEIFINKDYYIDYISKELGINKEKILNEGIEKIINNNESNPMYANIFLNIQDKIPEEKICVEIRTLSDVELMVYKKLYSKLKYPIQFSTFKQFALIQAFDTFIPNDRYITKKDWDKLIPFFKNSKMCCNTDFINKLILKVNNTKQRYNFDFPVKAVNDSLKNILEYCNIIKNGNYDAIYSLGDSLDKYNYILSFFDINITSVPFSGSMYTDSNGAIILVDSSQEEIIKESENMLSNNKAFRKMYNDIIEGKKVLITDYGLAGKAYLTIMFLIDYLAKKNHQQPENGYANLTYLQISFDQDLLSANIESQVIKYNYKYRNKMKYLYVDLVNFFPYFSNSEHSNSRCVSKYSVKDWNKYPKDVWSNGLIDNYFMCNLHRFFILMTLCCHIE